MSALLESWQAGWRPKDCLSREEWARKHVFPPGSARGTSLDLSLTPWLRQPVEYSEDNRVIEEVLLMPTGAGKTSVFDAVIPHAIAEDPGGILLGLQSIPDAKEYVEERLMPILKGAAPVAEIMDAMKSHAIRKGAVMFPHMPLYLASGVNLTTLQRRSVRYGFIDEGWRWRHGYIAEARARLHDRWNGRFIIISQGGYATILRDKGHVETELEAAWLRTDQREWCFQCPQCNEVQRYRQTALRYVRAEDSRSNLEENAIAESARYVCAGVMKEKPTCDAVFEDKISVRRGLSNTGRYLEQNPSHLRHHHGWHMNALGLYFVAWGTLAVEHAKAMASLKEGDDSAIRVYRQKRLAQNYILQPKVEDSSLTIGMIEDPNAEGGQREYTFADYAEGQSWPGEDLRILTYDVQLDHFWAVVRAWKVDGSSRRLWAGRVNTLEAIREMQLRLKVKDKWVFGDSKYDKNVPYNACGQYGWRALQGDQRSMYRFNPPKGKPYYKFYSGIRWVKGSSGKTAQLIFWASTPIKRILEKMRGGHRAAWECEGCMDPEHRAQLFSEIEKDVINKLTKAITRLFVKLRRDNHLFDCEGMQVTGALIGNMLADQPDPSPAKNATERPAAPDEAEAEAA